MNILMVISDTNIGGAGKWILEYFRHHNKDRFQVKAVVPTGSKLKPLYEDAGLCVIECDGIADVSYSKEGVKNLYRIFKKERPDIVHAHGTMSARVAAAKWGSHVKKIVYTRHSVFEPTGFFTKPIGKIVNRIITAFTCDRSIAVCEAAKKNQTDTGIPSKKISVVYNGVEAIPTPTAEQRILAKKSFSLSENDLVFSISARLNPVKGHKYLVEAVSKLSDRNHMKFLIAGTGPEEETLKAMVKEYQLEDCIICTGFLSDVSNLLYATDVLLNCSYGTEACSLAILEAYSLGIPCIATDYGGNPELVQTGKNGIVFPTNDSDALADAIKTLKEAPQLIRQYGDGAKETYQKGFPVELMAKNTEKVYEDLMK